MKFIEKIIYSLLFFSALHSFGQTIKEHQWKERVLLILTNDEHNAEYKKQLDQFNEETLDFKERKLIIYRITPKFYRIGFAQVKKNASTQLYKNYKKTKESVEVILIGLDGGIKLRKTSLLTKTDLFGLIDGMPMRKNELKNNK